MWTVNRFNANDANVGIEQSQPVVVAYVVVRRPRAKDAASLCFAAS
jgi:hypothetical protein